jgi:hypothetical protein
VTEEDEVKLGEGGCFFATFFAPKKVRNSARFHLAKNHLLIFRTIVRAISPTTIQKLHFRIFSKGEALA